MSTLVGDRGHSKGHVISEGVRNNIGLRVQMGAEGTPFGSCPSGICLSGPYLSGSCVSGPSAWTLAVWIHYRLIGSSCLIEILIRLIGLLR